MSEITPEEVEKLVLERGLTVEKVIDAIIDINGIIGVGLITLGETFKIYTSMNKDFRRSGITKDEIEDLVKHYQKGHQW